MLDFQVDIQPGWGTVWLITAIVVVVILVVAAAVRQAVNADPGRRARVREECAAGAVTRCCSGSLQ